MTFKCLFVFSSLVTLCLAGQLTVSYAPTGLRFGKSSGLRVSTLDDLLAAAMGYTPTESAWSGLTVVSPFGLPVAAVVVGIDGGGAVLQEGSRYPLQEDGSLVGAQEALRATVSARAQRPTHFSHVIVANSEEAKDVEVTSMVLRNNTHPDVAFLREVTALPLLAAQLDKGSSVPHGGQDFIFYELHGFSQLLQHYGPDSLQVDEAGSLLREAVGRLVAAVRRVYGDDVLVLTAGVKSLHDNIVLPPHTRTKRQLIGEQTEDVNLAAEYDADYPVMFNIILFLSITLIVALVASSASMAYMDPGRDSIIYRMTNPRMKKDQ